MVKLNLKCSTGVQVEVDVSISLSIWALKNEIARKISIEADLQHLVYKGSILKDDMTLESLGVADGHTIHVVKRSRRPASTTPSTTTSTPMPSPAPAPASTFTPPVPPQAAPFQNPFSAFGGMGGFGGAGGGMPNMVCPF